MANNLPLIVYERRQNKINKPVIIIAPHAHHNDDTRTNLIARQAANDLECYLSINSGFERAKNIDVQNYKANLNDIDHGSDQAIKPDWLDIIVQYKDNCIQAFGHCWIFLIHGMSDVIRQKTKDPNLDIIVGYGAGNSVGESCDPAAKDKFIYHLSHLGLTVYGGKKGGGFAGANPKNLNQLFTCHIPDPNVDSLQLEIVYSMRNSDKTAEACGKLLAIGIDNFLQDKIGVPVVPIKEC